MSIGIRKTWLSVLFALALALASPALAEEKGGQPGAAEATDGVAEDVQAEADEKTAERRKEIIQEAVDALDRSKEALTALEEERIDDALNALAVATGKLELIVARDPELALAPTDVSISTRDLYGTPEGIRRAIEDAQEALDDGKIQEARRLLEGLGSELVLTVTNIPLATYPDAIKAIVPLIDAGRIEDAKSGLRTALNTVVLTEHIYPLPLLRSTSLLEQAEELALEDARTEEEEEQLRSHLAEIRQQLEMGELLGYWDKPSYRKVTAQLARIEDRIEDGESGERHFVEIQQAMANLWR